MEPTGKTEVAEEDLPPPPSGVPSSGVGMEVKGVSVQKASKPKRVPMTRRGFGSKGQKISLLTNHVKIGITNPSGHFFHYSVSLCVCVCLFLMVLFFFTW